MKSLQSVLILAAALSAGSAAAQAQTAGNAGVPGAPVTALEEPVPPDALAPNSPEPPQDNVAACEAPRRADSTAPATDLNVEVSDEYGPYRSADVVTVMDASGYPLVTLDCDGAYANFRLAPGQYRVVASVAQRRGPEVPVTVGRTPVRIMVMLPPNPTGLMAGDPPPIIPDGERTAEAAPSPP